VGRGAVARSIGGALPSALLLVRVSTPLMVAEMAFEKTRRPSAALMVRSTNHQSLITNHFSAFIPPHACNISGISRGETTTAPDLV
jgi:hypothetical protein